MFSLEGFFKGILWIPRGHKWHHSAARVQIWLPNTSFFYLSCLKGHVYLSSRNGNAVSCCTDDMLIEWASLTGMYTIIAYVHLVGEYAGHEVNMEGLTNEVVFHDWRCLRTYVGVCRRYPAATFEVNLPPVNLNWQGYWSGSWRETKWEKHPLVLLALQPNLRLCLTLLGNRVACKPLSAICQISRKLFGFAIGGPSDERLHLLTKSSKSVIPNNKLGCLTKWDRSCPVLSRMLENSYSAWTVVWFKHKGTTD